MLIWMITRFLYRGGDPTEEFVGKDKEKAVAQNMKEKFGISKGKRDYDMNSISF